MRGGGKILFLLGILGAAAVGAGLLVGRALRPPADTGAVARGADAGTASIAPPSSSSLADAGPAASTVVTAVDAGGPDGEIALVPLETPRGARTGIVPGRRLQEQLGRARSPGPGPDDDDVEPELELDAGTAAPVAPVVVDAGPPPAPAAPDAGPPLDAGTAVAALRPPTGDPEALPRSPLTVTFEDQLATWLKLTALEVTIDGKRVVHDESEGGLDRKKRARIHEAKLFPGHHQVRVEASYVGQGGLFSYMEAYRFRLKDVVVVEVKEGAATVVDATAIDRGVMEAWEKRPALVLRTVPTR